MFLLYYIFVAYLSTTVKFGFILEFILYQAEASTMLT